MNVQSDNVGSNRPKLTLSQVIRNEIKQNEEEDIISRLPDEILIHILSFLPDADAYRTRILSNRWNHLCFFLPSLHFEMPAYDQPVAVVNKYYDFVDKTLSLRNRDMPVIKRFFLSSLLHFDHNRVLDLLRVVFRSKHLQTLNLESLILSFDVLMICNNTLVDLTLKDVYMIGLAKTQLLFPCLKILKLESLKYSGDESPQNLISACPVLHELCLDGQELRSQLHTFKIYSPSLKRLTIQGCVFGQDEVVIDAPKLEYFCIREKISPVRDYESSTYSLTNPSSLIEAYIDRLNISDIQLTNISFARILTMGRDSLWGLISHTPGFNLPVFPNLVKLMVGFYNIHAWDMLFNLLNSMPNLQHISIDFGNHQLPFQRIWNSPLAAPTCLCFMVKEIVIFNRYAVHVEDHVSLISYLLSHSSVLEKMTLSTFDIDRERREKLLKICRLSKTCQIEFV